jgi:heat shock protein HslJ
MKYLFMLLATGFIACNGTGSTTNTLSASDSAAKADSAAAADSLRPKPDSTSLSGSWYLVPVLPTDTGAGRTPQLNFNLADKTFTGNTGCNSMSGSFDYTDSSLVFNERIMMTKMACTGYNEGAFVKSLLRTNRFRFQDSLLVLMVQEEELSRWSRTPTKPPVSNKL